VNLDPVYFTVSSFRYRVPAYDEGCELPAQARLLEEQTLSTARDLFSILKVSLHMGNVCSLQTVCKVVTVR
jgi:hypothetical protein